MAEILVVDDDASARDLLTTVLGYANHQLREAHDGAEALVLLQDATPDLIIVDLLMPTMNGMEFVRRLRENAVTAFIPVIFYTASYLESQAKHLAELCGVAHFITKPAEPEQIFSVVSTALGATNSPLPIPAPLAMQHDYLAKLTAALSQKAAHVVPRLEAMIELGLRLASERDPQRLLADFCDASRKIIGAKFAMVAVRSNGESGSCYQFTSGLSAEVAQRLGPVQWQAATHQEVLATRHPRRLHGLPGDPSIVGLPPEHPLVHSYLCAPIQSPQRVYGWLSLIEGVNGFDDEDEALARILAAQVGRIYENGSLYREVSLYAEKLEMEVAERKQAQEEVRALNIDLERRIQERTAQLLEANAELETFGYTVSHDLRAPLRALSAYSSLTLESESSHLSDAGRRYLQASIDNARRMGCMVDDLLAFSRLGRQALAMQPVDMQQLVREVWDELLQQDRAPVQLQMGDLPSATADCGMLREVWTNLLANALKYSSKNPQRTVAILGSVIGADSQYSIRDNGVGFDMAYASKLFRVFERLHSAKEFEGTGAGLAIVERIVRRHGGRVWAESQLGNGAVFYFSLPRQ